MGCSAYDDEWSCIEALGLDTLQPLFEDHWNSWYNATDFTEMARLGINVVRIPLGCASAFGRSLSFSTSLQRFVTAHTPCTDWSVDSLIQDGEYFPTGSMSYIKQVCGWAKAAGSLFSFPLSLSC